MVLGVWCEVCGVWCVWPLLDVVAEWQSPRHPMAEWQSGRVAESQSTKMIWPSMNDNAMTMTMQ